MAWIWTTLNFLHTCTSWNNFTYSNTKKLNLSRIDSLCSPKGLTLNV